VPGFLNVPLLFEVYNVILIVDGVFDRGILLAVLAFEGQAKLICAFLIDEGFALMNWARSMDEALLLGDEGSVKNWEGLTDGLTMYYARIVGVFAAMEW